jgi:hypothetical protein
MSKRTREKKSAKPQQPAKPNESSVGRRFAQPYAKARLLFDHAHSYRDGNIVGQYVRKTGKLKLAGLDRPAKANTPWGTLDAVKVHRPRESASRGDDFDVKHRNTFCTFCHFHTDRARFDQVWVPATGLSSGLGRGDTIVATGLGAWPRRNLNPVGLLLAHRRNPARTTLYPLPLKAVRFVQYRTHTECRGSARCQERCIGQRGEVQKMKGPLLDTSISRGRSVGRQAAKFGPRA